MKTFLSVFVACLFTAAGTARAAYVGSVSTVSELVSTINPTGVNTNYFVREIDAICAWINGDATPTNVVPNGPFGSVKGSGRWWPVLRTGTNTYSITYVSNLFVTNLYVTNLYVTNINGDPYTANLWTNDVDVYRPTADQTSLHATNINSGMSLSTDGAFYTSPQTNALSPGTNNILSLFTSYIKFSSDLNQTDPSVCTLALGESTDREGQFLILENWPLLDWGVTNSAFSLYSGSSLWVGAGHVVLINGDWKPTKAGEGILLHWNGTDWTEISRFYGYAGGDGGVIINPTDGYLPYRSGTNSFGDSPFYHISTNMVGFITTNVFMIVATDPVLRIYDPKGVFMDDPLMALGYNNTFIGADAGKSISTGVENTGIGWESLKNLTTGNYNTAVGEAMGSSNGEKDTAVGWRALRTDTGSENVAVGYNAMADTSTNSIFIGARSGVVNNNLENVIAIGHSVKATNSNEIVIGNATNTKAIIPIASWTGTGTRAHADDGTFKEFASPGDTLWTNKSSILQPKDLILPVMITNQLSFSQGMTNVLKQNQADLEYTNGSSATKVIVSNGSGGGAIVYAQGTSAATFGVNGSANTVNLNNGSDVVQLFGHSWHPTTDGFSSLGSESGLRWKNQSLLGTNFIFGYRDVSPYTNYSRLATYHTGTNGLITFASQSGGIAGSPRPFDFNNYVGINGLPVFFGGGSYQANVNTEIAYITNIVSSPLTPGDTLIFTSPDGYKSIPLVSSFIATNAGTVYYAVKYRTNGTDYITAGTPGTSGTSNKGQVSINDFIARYSGDGYVYYVNTNEGPAIVSFLLVTNTIPIKTYMLTSLAAGDNVLYTVPTNTVAMCYNGTQGINPRYGNASGAPRTVLWYYLPLGQTTSTFPYPISTNTVSDLNSQSFGLMGGTYPPFVMHEGDSIVVNTDASTATQSAFVTVLEVPE